MNAPEQKLRVVGAKARRIEDPALLRGQGHYLDDVQVDGVLHAAFVRSPHAHAIIKSIDADTNFFHRYLQPLYGCTAFAVRDLLRRYMGWYDGNPSMLFPSTRASVAREVVALAGGVDAILRRVDELAAGDSAEQPRALHLVDFVIQDGREKVAEARRRKSDLLESRASGERSFVASNVLKSAAVLEREAVAKS